QPGNPSSMQTEPAARRASRTRAATRHGGGRRSGTTRRASARPGGRGAPGGRASASRRGTAPLFRGNAIEDAPHLGLELIERLAIDVQVGSEGIGDGVG